MQEEAWQIRLPMSAYRCKKEGADIHILSSLYDIAWLLNLRGGDIDHVPVFLSFVSIEKEQILLLSIHRS